MTPYPIALPTADIMLVITDIRSGAITSDKANFSKALWELTGFALKSTIGEPAGAPLSLSVAPTTPVITSGQVLTFLETSLKDAAANIPWSQIAQWGLTMLLTTLK